MKAYLNKTVIFISIFAGSLAAPVINDEVGTFLLSIIPGIPSYVPVEVETNFDLNLLGSLSLIQEFQPRLIEA